MYINSKAVRQYLKTHNKKAGKEFFYALNKRVEYLLEKAARRNKKVLKALDLY